MLHWEVEPLRALSIGYRHDHGTFTHVYEKTRISVKENPDG